MYAFKNKPLSKISLLFANAIAIFVALYQQWDIAEIMLVYWIQSIIIGIFQFIKILNLKDFSTENFRINGSPVLPTQKTKTDTAFFFLFHYNFFHFGYLVFILQKLDGADLLGLLFLALSFLANHAVSYFQNKKNDSRQVKNIGQIMLYPYVRIFPMHLIILFGSFLHNVVGISFFMILKTIADLLMHSIEHSKWATKTPKSIFG